MFNCNEYKYKNTSLLYLNSDIKNRKHLHTYIENEAHESNSLHLPFQVAIHTFVHIVRDSIMVKVSKSIVMATGDIRNSSSNLPAESLAGRGRPCGEQGSTHACQSH